MVERLSTYLTQDIAENSFKTIVPDGKEEVKDSGGENEIVYKK